MAGSLADVSAENAAAATSAAEAASKAAAELAAAAAAGSQAQAASDALHLSEKAMHDHVQSHQEALHRLQEAQAERRVTDTAGTVPIGAFTKHAVEGNTVHKPCRSSVPIQLSSLP